MSRVSALRDCRFGEFATAGDVVVRVDNIEGLSDEPSWMTESRNEGEDKRKVISGWWVGCVVAVSGNLRRRRTVGVAEFAEDLNRPARVGAKDVPA